MTLYASVSSRRITQSRLVGLTSNFPIGQNGNGSLRNQTRFLPPAE